MGFLSPFILRTSILMKRLWIGDCKGLGWDHPMPKKDEKNSANYLATYRNYNYYVFFGVLNQLNVKVILYWQFFCDGLKRCMVLVAIFNGKPNVIGH